MKKNPHFRPAEIAGVLMCTAGLGLITHLGMTETASEQTATKAHRIAEMTTVTALSTSTTQLNTAETVLPTTAQVTETKTAAAKAAAAESTQQPSTETVSFPLNLNTADAAELTALPGIGEMLAQRIIAYRTAAGGFQNREQLLEVDGIGEGRLMQIYDLLYIENEQYPEQTFATDAITESVQPNPEPSATVAAPDPLLPIDLNAADMETLLLLPDMTETLAAEILALREEIGGFSSTYELLYAESMTAQYFEEIRDFVQIIQ